MKSISGKLLETITDRLVAEFQPEQVILFGSHAWGEPNAGSDVDLLVIVSHSDLSEYERAKTRSEFDFPVREYKIAKRKVLYGKHVRRFCMRTMALTSSQNCNHTSMPIFSESLLDRDIYSHRPFPHG